jgi:hypothetical protein
LRGSDETGTYGLKNINIYFTKIHTSAIQIKLQRIAFQCLKPYTTWLDLKPRSSAQCCTYFVRGIQDGSVSIILSTALLIILSVILSVILSNVFVDEAWADERFVEAVEVLVGRAGRVGVRQVLGARLAKQKDTLRETPGIDVVT